MCSSIYTDGSPWRLNASINLICRNATREYSQPGAHCISYRMHFKQTNVEMNVSVCV